jgi:hypothetical protein
MRNVKTYRAALLRWLGVAADVAAAASSGAPIGITSAIADAGECNEACDESCGRCDRQSHGAQDLRPRERHCRTRSEGTRPDTAEGGDG